MASLCITGALRTTPSADLNVLLHLLPLDIISKQSAATTAVRLRELSEWSGNDCGYSKTLSMMPEVAGITDYALSESLFDKKYYTLIPDRDAWRDCIPGGRKCIDFYTDGSKSDYRVGFGVYSKDLGLSIARRLPDHCSVYQAEMMAIKEVAEWLRHNILTKIGINIFSDSQAAIKSLESIFLNSKTALSCRKSLNEMAEQFKIHLIWVPGHRDIPGNCKADELARLGTTLQIPGSLESVGMPLASCKLILRNRSIETTNQRWARLGKCEHSRNIWPKLDPKRSQDLLSLSKQNVSLIVSVVTGHCLIGRHAERLNVATSDLCRTCGDEEEEVSIKHLLCTCPRLWKERLNTLGSCSFMELADLEDVAIGRLLAFLRQSKWFGERN